MVFSNNSSSNLCNAIFRKPISIHQIKPILFEHLNKNSSDAHPSFYPDGSNEFLSNSKGNYKTFQRKKI